MLPCQRSELFGQGESDHEIVSRNLPLDLAFQPLLALMVLAVGAVAMAARMWHKHLIVALIALSQHDRALRGTALLHGSQRFAMTWQN